jgi:hypothetical protein
MIYFKLSHLINQVALMNSLLILIYALLNHKAPHPLLQIHILIVHYNGQNDIQYRRHLL